jgi:hypothetical protein
VPDAEGGNVLQGKDADMDKQDFADSAGPSLAATRPRRTRTTSIQLKDQDFVFTPDEADKAIKEPPGSSATGLFHA